MFLRSLTIKGFKSFADATTLEFEPGVTVVVGPNGSGKSNVVDAVAWVLGAQGPRTVRSAKMEDVIFAGTPKRAALGRAEVSLTIDNSDGLLAVDFAEVTITRTLFRTGESEYAINRVPCRLLDVQELLSDTGVGRQQHVIVSQGNLDAILNSRPEDRRLVIEEAAGVLKYRRRKERSERRLESTEGNLVRLQDLLREVRRQLRPLEKQADAARRHGDVVAELHALRTHLAGRELAVVESRLRAGAARRSELEAGEREVRSALAGLDAEVLAAEAELSAVRRRGDAADLAEAVSRAEALRARAAGLVALVEQRRRGLARELAVTVDHDVVASLEAEAADLVRQREENESDAALLGPQADEVAEAESALAAEAERVEEEWRRDGPVATDPAGEVRGELGALRSATERARAELRRLDGRVAALDQRTARLTDEADRVVTTLTELDLAADGLRRESEEAVAAAETAEAAMGERDEARRAADAERHRWQARAEALTQALDRARARAGAERLAGVAGVVGTILELVAVDAGWEAAFEAAVGEALAAVVVDDPGAARRSLAALRDQRAGGAVVALDAGVGPSDPVPPPGAVALRRHVRSRLPAGEALLDRLLGHAFAVTSWDEALELAVARPDLVVVTSDGDRFAGGLWRTGAGSAGATGAALAEAEAAAAAALSLAETAASQAAVARRRREDAVAARQAAAAAVESASGRRRSAEEVRRRLANDLADATDEQAAGGGRRRETASRLAVDEARIAELEALLPELETLAAAEVERAMAERAARACVAERAASVASARQDLQIRASAHDQRRVLVERRLAEVEGRLARNVGERDAAAGRRERLAAQAWRVEAVGAVVAVREHEVAAAVERLRRARRVETEATREISERLDSRRRQRASAERQLVETREHIGRCDVDDAETRLRLENLTETVRRDLDCEPEATRSAPCPELPPGSTPEGRRVELERDLRLMGPINPLALEEHAALTERHTFLEAQLDDVRSARRELAKVIRAVDGEIVEVFRAAFTDVADNFEKLFATLFPGGQGRLRLTNPDHLLDTGIEVEARPSGKNVRRLSLLSGGERSLTALAFLFAVFRSRPSPFYLMDEVEAALDDVNLHRFLDLLHEFRSEAQLLVVSHQKRTMEAADCLYGVTMAPGGSSRVVSERVGTAPALP